SPTPRSRPGPRDAALKADIALFEERGSALKLTVQPTQRRAAIAGDKACGIEAVTAIQRLLRQAKAHQRLEPRHKYPPLAEVVFVVEFDVAQRHHAGLFAPCGKGQFALTGPILPEGG